MSAHTNRRRYGFANRERPGRLRRGPVVRRDVDAVCGDHREPARAACRRQQAFVNAPTRRHGTTTRSARTHGARVPAAVGGPFQPARRHRRRERPERREIVERHDERPARRRRGGEVRAVHDVRLGLAGEARRAPAAPRNAEGMRLCAATTSDSAARAPPAAVSRPRRPARARRRRGQPVPARARSCSGRPPTSSPCGQSRRTRISERRPRRPDLRRARRAPARRRPASPRRCAPREARDARAPCVHESRTFPGVGRHERDRPRKLPALVGSTSSAASPATSGSDDVSAAITGQPQAMASSTGMPKPS